MNRVNLINRLPPFLQNKEEYIQAFKAKDVQFILLWEKINECFKNLYLYELTEYGIKRWEKIMKITPKASDTLDDRRFRIINRYLTNVPYTYRKLEQILNTICGKDGYKLELDHLNYILKVKLELSAKKQLEEVEGMLRRIIPANLVLEVSILYNQHSTISRFTHEQLKVMTHKTIREEVLN